LENFLLKIYNVKPAYSIIYFYLRFAVEVDVSPQTLGELSHIDLSVDVGIDFSKRLEGEAHSILSTGKANIAKKGRENVWNFFFGVKPKKLFTC
jgi:hypothetical protein